MTGPLPPDPDGLNDARAAWAGRCIDLMVDQTCCEPGSEALSDLLCNIFHWGDRNGFAPADIRALFDKATRMHRDETMPFEKDY